jgi:hypothetical protein
MYPFIREQLAAEHIKDQLAAANDARRARQARRAQWSRGSSGAPGTRTIPAHCTACWLAACRVAAMLRDIHREQVHAVECICLAGRAPVDRRGPLTWIPGLDGPRLVGSWLPAPDTDANPDQ